MYISNFSIIGQGPNYGKYKTINKYDENVSVSNLLSMGKPLNLLDMYQPNSITDISSITDSHHPNKRFYNLHRYIYDQTTNPNGPIKKDATTNSIASLDNWTYGSSSDLKLFYISGDKILSEGTFNNAENIIMLHPLDYYYYNVRNDSLTVENKPINFKFNEANVVNSIYVIGNVTPDVANKLESGTLDTAYILFKSCTISSNQLIAFDRIFVLCDDPTKYQFKINDVGLNNNLPMTNYNNLYYVTIIETTSFNFKVLEMNGTLIQQVNITIQ